METEDGQTTTNYITTLTRDILEYNGVQLLSRRYSPYFTHLALWQIQCTRPVELTNQRTRTNDPYIYIRKSPSMPNAANMRALF